MVGRLVVRLADPPEGLVVEVAGKAVALGEEVVVEPGELRVDAMVPGRPLHRQTVTARPATIVELRLTLPEPAPPPSLVAPAPAPDPAASGRSSVAPAPAPSPAPSPAASGGGLRIAGFVVLGLSAVGFVTFATAGVMANNRFSSVEDACGGRCTDPAFNDDIDGGRTLDVVANVGLGAGLGLGVAGALMVIFGGAEDVPEAALRVSPRSGGAEIGVAGSF
jgi:hypothetical protein